MKWTIFFFAAFGLTFFCHCKNGKSPSKKSSIDIIDRIESDSIFKLLQTLTNNRISKEMLDDSLAFLIVPLQQGCPSCLDKTIDSILKHKDDIAKNRIVIISAKAGRKNINSYFRDRKGELPTIPNQLFLDSFNLADKHKLFDTNPAIYYTANRKAYKKVFALPETIKRDLRDYFSASK